MTQEHMKVVIEIPHQRPASVYCLSLDDLFSEAYEQANTEQEPASNSGQDKMDFIKEVLGHDLHGFYVFDNLEEAERITSQWNIHGHQVARVRALLHEIRIRDAREGAE